MPKSIENYAQEIGRAGRDGAPADCLVLANHDNVNVLENFVYGDTPERDALALILAQISEQQGPWEIVENSLSLAANIKTLTLKTLLVYLELLGIIKPLYSYFAEYKYKFIMDKQQILAKFSGERASFIAAIFDCSSHAKIWSTLDFGQLEQRYHVERSRVVSALNYLEEHQAIELQTKQMTQVFEVLKRNVDVVKLSDKLSQKFNDKEQSEIARIKHLLDFFASPQCLSQSLSRYFSDHSLTQGCGHCSVCQGQVAVMPPVPPLKTVDQQRIAGLSGAFCQLVVDKTAKPASAILLARFLCGLHTPLFTRLKARSVGGFAALEHYPFATVKQWALDHLALEAN